jgi:hypothetical protein
MLPRMATTFIGVEIGRGDGQCHALVVLRRRKNQVDLYDWSCAIDGDDELLNYLSAVAGRSGVIAVHDDDPAACGALMKRLWRVLDYRQSVELAPRLRTRALVRVHPPEVAETLGSDSGASPVTALERAQHHHPAVDFLPITRAIRRSGGTSPELASAARQLAAAGLAAYAALWCWWHGPAGYDVLGERAETYRLAPRIMDLELDIDATLF